jgi:pyruvate/2-oxoglutarate dehydrogenase complex dihydrolipoamide acyltransferase (E2) component
MKDVRLSTALWAARLLPEGLVEKWHVAEGTRVARGEALASVSIEGALHEITAPCGGRLSIAMPENSMVEPGAIIGTVDDGA